MYNVGMFHKADQMNVRKGLAFLQFLQYILGCKCQGDRIIMWCSIPNVGKPTCIYLCARCLITNVFLYDLYLNSL